MTRIGVAALFIFALNAGAEERLIPVVASNEGANGTYFRSDVRILAAGAAPATIEVELNLPGERLTRTITATAHQMIVLDDVVGVLFDRRGGGYLVLRSSSAFSATARTYTAFSGGTAGQFIASVPPDSTLADGVLLHLGHSAEYRSNIGFTNPAAVAVTASCSLHASEGALLAQAQLATGPSSVVQTGIGALFGGVTFNDGYVIFRASSPVIGFASVVDNRSGDSIFISAAPVPAASGAKVFEVTARQFQFRVIPGGFETVRANAGDTVTLRVRSADVLHGFSMPGFIEHLTLLPGEAIERTFTVPVEGTFPFFCTIECGSGHHSMRGQMEVTPK